MWHSFYHHGKFSGPDKKLTLEQINTKTKESAAYLKNIDFLFITFGTAWMYRHNHTGKIVSNCHKIPANQFERFRMDVNEIVNRFSVLLDEFFTLNRKAKIVFTVSPIRHWKDGAVENQRSKAALTLAVEQIINNTGNQRCAYFPAYEIVMDELRDYRFYTEDMIHLTGFTIQHIWQKFKETLVDEISEEISGKVQQIINAANHKPFNKNTQKHLSFLNNSLKKTVELETKYKYLNLTLEKAYFNNQINEIKGIQ